MWNSNDKIDYLPRKTKLRTIKKLTKRDNIRRQMDNMREEGFEEFELEEWRKQRISEIFNLHNPFSITNGKEDDDKNAKSEESIQLEYKNSVDQEEVVSYLEDREEIKKLLIDSKETLFKNSNAGKAYINHIIDNIGNDSAKFTNREIAKSTGYHEDTIGRMRKKLSKNIPLLWELLT